MLDAGKYFLEKQGSSAGVSNQELIDCAIRSLGLNELSQFDPSKKIIEYLLKNPKDTRLVDMSVTGFANETASDSPAPGGGSIAALAGALGASLGTMVANLSAGKRGWEDRVEEFSIWAEKGQQLKDRLLFLVDEDTRAFDAIMQAFGLPKDTPEQVAERKAQRENIKMKMLTEEDVEAARMEAMDEIMTQLPPEAMENPEIMMEIQNMPAPAVISVDDFDMHEVHIETHNKFRMSQESEILSDVIKAQFAEHVSQHEQAIQQKMMAQMMMGMPPQQGAEGGSQMGPGAMMAPNGAVPDMAPEQPQGV
jgi:formiminotetrahydrofolate cyclodeaminase